MPARSRDLPALRRFAEAHAAAHVRAATVRPDAACGCRRQRCAAHEGTRVDCSGSVLLVLRHDPAVGQVWTLSEVCAACAALMTHTRIVGKPVPRTRPPRQETVAPLEAPSPGGARSVPAGFSPPPVEAGVPSRPDRRRR
ncbi:hypothetical protein OH768_02575 [Streptomyces sp. NBC_01622]|uniref:hypothetical protein n=1 Tax=Streptomyces sp. NBC_01622 TaxID=2975903 RepID=UPI00386C4733|nr:hypothetical protein OH768_02575 [Streptomyces sp. NBC_01622]